MLYNELMYDTPTQDILSKQPEQAEASSVWSPAYRSLTIGLLMIITAAAFETLAVATIMPVVERDLGQVELYGWVFSAFFLTKLVSISLTGAEVDRLGPTLPFTIGVICFVSGLLLGGLAQSMPMLITGRALQGLGAGAISAVAYAVLARAYPEHLKPRMLALNSTAWIVPGLIGPGIAGVIASYVSWRWVFLGLLPFPIIALFMALPSLRKMKNAEVGSHRLDRALLSGLLAFGAGMFLAGLNMPILWRVPMLVGGAILTLSALYRLTPPGTLRAAPGLPAAIACMAFLSLTFFGADTFVPLTLSTIRGQSALITALILTSATITWTVGSWILDRIAPWVSRRMVVVIGLILIAVSIAKFALTLLPGFPIPLSILAWALCGLGIGLCYTTLSLIVLELAPAGREGVSTAALQLTDNLGTALGAGIGGAIVANLGKEILDQALGIQFVLMAILCILAIPIALRLPGVPGIRDQGSGGGGQEE